MKFLSIFFLLFFTLLYGENIDGGFETTIESIDSIEEIEITPQEIYLSKITKSFDRVYKNQILTVEYKLLMLQKEYNEISTKFLNSPNIEVLNEDSRWRRVDNNNFINRYYYKILDEIDVKLPDLKIEVSFVNKKESTLLSGERLDVVKLSTSSENIGVIAQNLEVVNSRATIYDDRHNILVIELKGLYSNLEDFRSTKYRFQGVESIKKELPTTEIIYYVIVPRNLDFFSFDYFNIEKNDFMTIKVVNIADDEKVSTQSEIVPKNINQKYKIALFAMLSLLFLILFIIYKSKISLAISLVWSTFLIFYLLPQKTIFIKEGASVTILPTQNSTVFQKAKEDMSVKEISRRDEFIKVLFEDGKIGWIKERDVIKD